MVNTGGKVFCIYLRKQFSWLPLPGHCTMFLESYSDEAPYTALCKITSGERDPAWTEDSNIWRRRGIWGMWIDLIELWHLSFTWVQVWNFCLCNTPNKHLKTICQCAPILSASFQRTLTHEKQSSHNLLKVNQWIKNAQNLDCLRKHIK